MSRSTVLVLSPALALSLAVGCAPSDDVALDLRASLTAATRGVALHDDGLADIGMAGQICLVDSRSGAVLGDRDLADGAETVLDARGFSSLGLAGGRLHLMSARDVAADQDLGLSAQAARFTEAGFVAIEEAGDACVVDFSDASGRTAWSVEGGCGADFAVDPLSGTAWLAADTLTAVRPDGAVLTVPEAGAEHVAWLASDDLALVASGPQVRAVSPDGAVAWTVTVDGTVADLATSDAGVAVISVAQEGGGGEVVVIGADGEERVTHLTPTVPEVTVSADGLSVALITGSEVHFYDLDPNASPLAAPTTEQAEGLGDSGAAWSILWGAAAASAILD